MCLQVVKVGTGKKKEDSEEVVKPNVNVGQTVMYSKYSGTEFEVGCLLHRRGLQNHHHHRRRHPHSMCVSFIVRVLGMAADNGPQNAV